MSYRVEFHQGLAALVLVVALCHCSSAEAQSGISLRGSIQGLPASGITLPTPTALHAMLYVLAERGSSALPVQVVFAANWRGLRTADASATALQTRIVNGQFLDLHVLPEAGQLVVRVVREVPTLRVTGVVTELRDGNGVSIAGMVNQTTDCDDPRDCISAGQTGRMTINLGQTWQGATVSIDTGYGTAFSDLIVGCQHTVDVAEVRGRLFATRISRQRGPLCAVPTHTNPNGVALQGWLGGLPEGGIALPAPSPVGAATVVPADRWTVFGSWLFAFPPGLFVRTQDAEPLQPEDQFTTRVANSQMLDLHFLPGASSLEAWIVRDVSTLRLKGRVTDLRDDLDMPLAGMAALEAFCLDPRSCGVGRSQPGRFTIDLGLPSGNAEVTVDIGVGTLLSTGLCVGTEVGVEAAVAGGRLFAVRIEGVPCPIPWE